MTSPKNPKGPFDGKHLSDAEVLALTKIQIVWVDLDDHQWKMLLDREASNPHIPAKSEARPEHIPAPEHQAKIKRLFDWIDSMYENVRRPEGMPWIEIQLRLASLHQLMEWVNSDPPISRYFRFRIDAPMDPNDNVVPDHPPEDWK